GESFAYLFGNTLQASILLQALIVQTSEHSEAFLKAYADHVLIQVAFIGALCFLSWILGIILGWRDAKNFSKKISSGGSLDSHIDPWFLILDLSERRTSGVRPTVRIDIRTKGRDIYSGELLHYNKTKDGDLLGISLKNCYRYITDPLASEVHKTKPEDSKDAKQIPGKYIHFMSSDISNINLALVKLETKSSNEFLSNFVSTPGAGLEVATKELEKILSSLDKKNL
ncbi:MAG: hypothetical protein ABIQ95_00640, partial [Bdellovibrionia bacterium]